MKLCYGKGETVSAMLTDSGNKTIRSGQPARWGELEIGFLHVAGPPSGHTRRGVGREKQRAGRRAMVEASVD